MTQRRLVDRRRLRHVHGLWPDRGARLVRNGGDDLLGVDALEVDVLSTSSIFWLYKEVGGGTPPPPTHTLYSLGDSGYWPNTPADSPLSSLDP
jgi:hypothetical protein